MTGISSTYCDSKSTASTLITPKSIAKVTIATLVGTAALMCGLWTSPAVAKDPFRTTNPHAIGDQTEAAFKAIFAAGDYKTAKTALQQAEPNEPLAYGMKASLAYMEQDWEALRENATRTRTVAEQLLSTDPLRGNLYMAAGHFLEGAYVLTQQGTVRGTPDALNRLQLVFKYLKAAEKIDANDPELNMIKGFMDLMLAVNLPFSSPNDAIDRLDKYAGPRYLAYRGIALGYRDLKQETKAVEFANKALQLTPANPDVLYLKAQLLATQGKYQESLEFFKKAMDKKDQLPRKLAAQIGYEECMAQGAVDRQTRDQRHPFCLQKFLQN